MPRLPGTAIPTAPPSETSTVTITITTNKTPPGAVAPLQKTTPAKLAVAKLQPSSSNATTAPANADGAGDQGGDESSEAMKIVIGLFAAFVAMTCAAFGTVAYRWKSRDQAQAAPFALRMATNANAGIMNMVHDDPHTTSHVADGELYDEVSATLTTQAPEDDLPDTILPLRHPGEA